MVEGGKSVCNSNVVYWKYSNMIQGKQKGNRNDIVRQKEPG